jgi:hypothetical protein
MTKKKQAELLEVTMPEWVRQRPVSSLYYYGIGIIPKVGAPMLYEDKAKERALADISSQINATIKSETFLYQVEDRNGVMEYLQNRIKSTSSEYLEGYEYVEKWEDLSNMYVFYRLSKQKHQEVKARRKRDAFKAASEKYILGIQLSDQGKHVEAIENFLSGYLNESTSTLVEGKDTDLVAESKKQMNEIIHSVMIIPIKSRSDMSANKFILLDKQKRTISNFPVKYKYTGGYLTMDRSKSNEKGETLMPELPKSNGNTSHTFTVEIDLVNLARQVTRNLYVRKLIEKQKAISISFELM